MISVNKALFRSNEIISSAISSEVISTLHSNGRILAEEILADINIPSDDNSAMDGYAIKLNDALDCGLRLPVTIELQLVNLSVSFIKRQRQEFLLEA